MVHYTGSDYVHHNRVYVVAMDTDGHFVISL